MRKPIIILLAATALPAAAAMAPDASAIRHGSATVTKVCRGSAIVWPDATPPDYLDNLSVWYTFDDNAANTIVGSSVPGVPDAAATLNTSLRHAAGMRGGAFSLAPDANGRFSVVLPAADAYVPMGSSARTVCCWMRWTSTDGQNFGYLWSFPGTWVAYQCYSCRLADGPQTAINLAHTGYFLDLNLSGALEFDRWHHVAWTYDGAGTACIYVDGALRASAGDWGMLNTTPSENPVFQRLVIADDLQDSYERAFGGLMDDFRIYSVALTPGQLAAVITSAGGTVAEPAPPQMATVSFDATGGTFPEGAQTSAQVMVGAPYGFEFPQPAMEGYTFGGWYSYDAGAWMNPYDTVTMGFDHTLYAMWY